MYTCTYVTLSTEPLFSVWQCLEYFWGQGNAKMCQRVKHEVGIFQNPHLVNMCMGN